MKDSTAPQSGREAATGPASWSVVCFGSVDFASHHQRPQAVMRDLAERGARILYLDNLGVRLPGIRDLPRVVKRLEGMVAGPRTVPRAESDGAGRTTGRLVVDSPLIPPLQQYAPVRDLARAALLRRIRRRLPPGRPLVAWTYLPLPVVASVAADLRADLLVYEWADDASARVLTRSPALRRRLADWEDRMAERAGVVFVASAELRRRRGLLNPETHVVPHGVGWSPSMRGDPPPEVVALPRPRIGFVGSLSEWVDLDLVERLARERPAWSFVLVGPQRVPLGRLAARPNVHLMGSRPHADVPGILEALDVGLIPYRTAPATEAASPIKLREYLAAGLPMVATDLPEVRAFAPDVEVATGLGGFVSALDRALERGKRPPQTVRAWSDAVDEMVAVVEDALARRER